MTKRRRPARPARQKPAVSHDIAQDDTPGFVFKSPPRQHGAWPGALSAMLTIGGRIRQSPAPALLLVGISLTLGILAATLEPTRINTVRLLGAGVIVNLALALAIPRYCLALADERPMGLGDFLWFDTTRYLTVLVATGLSAAAVVLSVIFLVVPVIWILPWFFLSPYIAADPRQRAGAVILPLRESRRLALRHKAKVWSIVAVTMTVFLFAQIIGQALGSAGFMANVLGTGVSIMLGGTAAMLYRWLQADARER